MTTTQVAKVDLFGFFKHPAGGMICIAPSGDCKITAMADHPDLLTSSTELVTLWLGQFQTSELAAQLKLSVRAVERKVPLIRRLRSQEFES